ncbi:gp42 [Alphaproteobacteria phage PhiJL001]|uniref:Gp42 n=1 Tax=Alphaproteobacteria phage PhiJL001 TaxID=2681607 RepID=Q5DN63_9CAUD|nr:gp42 [Alphaproteobacteria phage PhiJL001]AAT69518.1 gp42 [Alphaproteobacteria phage PhiJL001]
MFNAAMKTALPRPGWIPYRLRGSWSRGGVPGKQPTDLMVHVAGHGPRRVYHNVYRGGYFIIHRGRRQYVDINEVLRKARGE